jgi:hypothetical protein
MKLLGIFLSLLLCCSHEENDVGERTKPVSDFTNIAKTVPSIFGMWKITPDIKLCPNSPVDRNRMLEAVRFWELLGYNFGSVIVNDTSSSCFTHGSPVYTITVEMNNSSFDEAHAGQTELYYDSETREIVGARIYMKSSMMELERVLEHELGHSLGWRHFNRRGHIMHGNHTRGGNNTFGLSNEIHSAIMSSFEKFSKNNHEPDMIFYKCDL